jgi:hypothetical protein
MDDFVKKKKRVMDDHYLHANKIYHTNSLNIFSLYSIERKVDIHKKKEVNHSSHTYLVKIINKS